MKLVNYCSYYDPTGRELTELRVRMYENIVDEFVICETNVTHMGLPARQGLENLIIETNLPREKIHRLELNLPDPPPVIPLDYRNTYEGNTQNKKSVEARARERMQRDALLTILDRYDDDTYFIICDQDEFINPEYIPWVLRAVDENPHAIVKIPLVHLEGRADLRVNVREGTSVLVPVTTPDGLIEYVDGGVTDGNEDTSERPKLWDCALVVVKKHHLMNVSIIGIRSNNQQVYPSIYLSIDGKRVEDMGWHFSWMGQAKERIAKVEGFCHYEDKFGWLETGGYSTPETKAALTHMILADGMMPPSCNKYEVLRDYPITNLPAQIWTLPRVKAYLLPDR